MNTELFTHLDNQPAQNWYTPTNIALRDTYTPALFNAVASLSSKGRRTVILHALMGHPTDTAAMNILESIPNGAEVEAAVIKLRDLLNPHVDRLYTPKLAHPIYATLCSM